MNLRAASHAELSESTTNAGRRAGESAGAADGEDIEGTEMSQ